MRQIESDLKTKLDERLFKSEGYFTRNAKQLFIETAFECSGIKEQGPNRGEWIELFQKTVDLRPGDPWCMAFVQSIIAYVEISTGQLSSVASGGACVDVFNRSHQAQVTHPQIGDILIWQKVATQFGHTGIIHDFDDEFFYTIEGNTNLAGLREGDGVYFKQRSRKNTANHELMILGILRPF